MAPNNISSGGAPPQHPRGLLALLDEVDVAAAMSLLGSSEGSTPRLPSPFTGRLLSMHYDPVKVLELVNELWPSRVRRHPGRGRKPKDPLPIVCYLLPFCDPEYGKILDLATPLRRLEVDEDYQRECGYDEDIPSRSVFWKISTKMANNWDQFQTCLLSPDEVAILSARFSSGHVNGDGLYSLQGSLSAVGWREGLPPHYQDDGKVRKALRVVGKPRGRTSLSRAVPTEEGVLIHLGDDCGDSQSSIRRYTRD